MFDVAESICLQCLVLVMMICSKKLRLLGMRESHIGSDPPDFGGGRAKLSS